MASYKVFALFALLALYAAGASATSFLWYTPPMMQPYPLAMLQQQHCMTLMMQGIMSPECQQFGAMYPITHQMQQQLMQGLTTSMQLPCMRNTAAIMNNPLAYPMQCVAGCSC
ncbi:hypothetical protein PVAP13_9NG234100 [Panicum virgatum]|uniref:Bifunctional inhibitor/plant lipid transfer protein/seed storage helical domain-containing protein n=1 Tax=Panicum virgatum TaxID=38727 RepID=A0A8T0MJH3_PANVG|nr:hypothetical protein PVAP13_9NG234100 [Panicum virgatum]